jgi:HAE1 family hydrophobic/amphiphilic exporter-1
MLPDFANRIDNDEAVKTKMRRHFDEFPGATLSFAASGMSMGGGGNVDIIVKSEDLNLGRSTAQAIQAVLEEQAADYVTEPSIDLSDGLPQVNIVIDRERLYNLGLSIYAVSNEIKANINGQVAGRYRDAGNEIDIVVSLDEADRQKLNDLEQIFVTNSSGARIPLSSFASYQEGTSPVAINRENQARTIHVTATALPTLSLDKVQAHVERVIQASVPHNDQVTIEYGGDYESFQENIIQFAIIILMAVILVFAVMASQFESFLDPFIVLFTIPLSVIGIVAVYLIMGNPFNMITAVGLLILVGVIVNNGIVLVDYTNLLRKRGLTLKEACIEAARNRLRPILMTTLTTVLGLIPMAFFPGEGSNMVQPIGQTVFGGLSFGTLMTLFLMPTMYYLFNRFREKRVERKSARKARRGIAGRREAKRLAAAKRNALEDLSGTKLDDSWRYSSWGDDVPELPDDDDNDNGSSDTGSAGTGNTGNDRDTDEEEF